MKIVTLFWIVIRLLSIVVSGSMVFSQYYIYLHVVMQFVPLAQSTALASLDKWNLSSATRDHMIRPRGKIPGIYPHFQTPWGWCKILKNCSAHKYKLVVILFIFMAFHKIFIWRAVSGDYIMKQENSDLKLNWFIGKIINLFIINEN